MNKNLKKSNMSKILYTFIIVNLMFPTEMIYAAGIKLDQSVNKQYNSTIGKTKNGIDQIDIVNPNNGISHNKFLEYNVNQRGVILNNSKELVQTNLAGLIDGNANLTNNADLIITEVTGTNRSDIEGFTEIAGQKADYVLANPNGVFLNGAGFLNTNRVTVSTGKVLNDGDLSLQVRDGLIEVGSKGVSTENVDYFTLLARAAKINGEISSNTKENMAKEMEILTGKNKYNYKTKKLTTIDSKNDGKYNMAIDSSKLGGLMAGRIKLVGTEEGLGVNTVDLVAPEKIEISADGRIVSKDMLSKNIELNSKESEIQGTVRTENLTGGNLLNKGNIVTNEMEVEDLKSAGEIIVNENLKADTVSNIDKITAKKAQLKNLLNSGTFVLENLNSEKLTNEGTINANIILSKELENNGLLQASNKIETGQLKNKKDILTQLLISNGIENLGKLQANTSITANDLINVGDILSESIKIKNNLNNTKNIQGNLSVEKEATNSGIILSDEIFIQGKLTNKGSVIGKKSIELNDVLNESEILSNDKISLNKLENKEEAVIGGKLITGAQIINYGSINGSLEAKDLENRNSIKGDKIKVTEKFDNKGNILSNDLDVTSETILNEGEIRSKEIQFNSKILSNKGKLISEVLTLDIIEKIINEGYLDTNNFKTKAELKNTGELFATNVEVGNNVENSGLISGNVILRKEDQSSISLLNDGKIVGDLDFKLNNFINNGTLKGNIKIDYTADNDLDLIGEYIATNLDIKAKKSIKNNKELKASSDIKLNSQDGNILNEGKIISGQDIILEAKNIENGITKEALIESSRNISINGNYKNEKGTLLGGTGKTTLNMKDNDFTNKNKIMSRGNLEINVSSLINESQILAGNSLTINSTGGVKNTINKIIYAKNNMKIEGSNLDNYGTLLTSDGDVNLEFTGYVGNIVRSKDNNGLMKAGNNLNVTAKEFRNEGYKYENGSINTYDPEGFVDGKAKSLSFSHETIYEDGWLARNRITNWKNFSFTDFFTVVEGGDLGKTAYNNQWDSDYDYSDGNHYMYEVGGTVKIGSVNMDPIKVKQALVEAKNINMNLESYFNNRGIISAKDNIHIKANQIINETEVLKKAGVSEYKGKAQATIVDSNITGDHSWYSDGPKIYDIKTKEYVNISEDKAKIMAGGSITLEGNVINTDTTTGIKGSDFSDTIQEKKDINQSNQEEIKKQTSETEKDFDNSKVDDISDKIETEKKAAETKKEQEKEERKTAEEKKKEEQEKLQNQIEKQAQLDVKKYIEVPKGDDGLFKKNEDFGKTSNNRPLIETNIEFIDQSKYFGSDYFYKKINYTPDSIRSIGDAYYETSLINKVIKKNFDKIESKDESEMMKSLIDNAGKVYEELSLEIGKEPTKEQLAKLDRDIVWYVEKEVQGSMVLVPQLYVGKNTEKKEKMSVISGSNVTIKNGSLHNTGSILAKNTVRVDTNKIINEYSAGRAKIEGANVYLTADKNIENRGSVIKGTNVLVHSKNGDVKNETLIKQNNLINSESYRTEIVGVAKIEGDVVNIKADNYYQKGAILKGKDGSIETKGEANFEIIELKSRTKEDGYHLNSLEENKSVEELAKEAAGTKSSDKKEKYTGTKYSKDRTKTQNVGSIVNFKGNFVIDSKGDVNIKGSSIEANEAKIQGKNVNITAVKDIENSKYESKKVEFAYSKEEKIDKYTETALSSNIKTQGDLTLIANEGDITFKGSSREAGGKITSLAEKGSVKDLTFELTNKYERNATETGFNSQTLGESEEVKDARKNVLDKEGIKDVSGTNAKQKHSSNAGIETEVDNLHARGFINGTSHSELYASGSATVGFVVSQIKENVDSTLHERTTVKAGEEVIIAKGDITRESIKGDIKGDSFVKSLEGDVKYTTVKDKVTSNVNKNTFSIGQEYSYKIAPLEFVEKIKKKVDYSNESSFSAKNAKAAGKETPGEGAEAAARFGETMGDISKLSSGEIASVSTKSGYNITNTNKYSNKGTALQNELNIGGTQTLIGKNVSLEGIKGEMGNLKIKAKKLDVTAAKDTYEEDNVGYSLFWGSQGSASVNAKGASVSAEGAFDLAVIKSDTDSSTYHTGNIKVKNNVNLDIEKDVTFKGLGIKGKNVNANIGGDLKIESLQNKVDYKAINVNVNASGGVSMSSAKGSTPTPTASVGATYGQVTENKAWVKEQAGLVSSNEYNVDVAGKTTLIGAKLGSETAGKTNFSTKELSVKDVKDTHDRGGFYGGGGLSGGKDGIGGVDVKFGTAEGYERAQDTKTTIGTGNIKVNGKDANLDDTNRDFENSQVKTKDKVIFKTDFDFSFDTSKKKKNKKKNSSADADGGDSSTTTRRNSNDDTDHTYSRIDDYDTIENVNKSRNLNDSDGPDDAYDHLNGNKKNNSEGENIYNRANTNDDTYDTANQVKRDMSSDDTYSKTSTIKDTDADTDTKDHTYFILEPQEDQGKKGSKANDYDDAISPKVPKEIDDTYDHLNGGKKGNTETENVYGKGSAKKVSDADETYATIDETKMQENPNKGRPLPEIPEDKKSAKKVVDDEIYDTIDESKMTDVADTDAKDHTYFILEPQGNQGKKTIKERDTENTYDHLNGGKKGSPEGGNIYGEGSAKKENPNKGRPLPETPTERKVREEAGYELAKDISSKESETESIYNHLNEGKKNNQADDTYSKTKTIKDTDADTDTKDHTYFILEPQGDQGKNGSKVNDYDDAISPKVSKEIDDTYDHLNGGKKGNTETENVYGKGSAKKVSDADETYATIDETKMQENPNKGRPLPEIPEDKKSTKKVVDDEIYDTIDESKMDDTYDHLNGNKKNPSQSENIYDRANGNDDTYDTVNQVKRDMLSDDTYSKTLTIKDSDADTDTKDHTYFTLEKDEKANAEVSKMRRETETENTYDHLNGGKKGNPEGGNIYGEGSAKKVSAEDDTYATIDETKMQENPNKGRPLPEIPEDKKSSNKVIDEEIYDTIDESKMDDTYDHLNGNKKNPSKGENIYDRANGNDDTYDTVNQVKRDMLSDDTYSKTLTIKDSDADTDTKDHTYFTLEKDEKANAEVSKMRRETETENTYDHLNGGKKGNTETENVYGKGSAKKVSDADETYATIDETKMQENPNKGRVLPKLLSNKESEIGIKETVKNKGFSEDEGNKVHKEAVAKLKIIANSADNLPTEHLMKALNDITGLDVNEYDKLTRDPKTGKINPKAREYFQKTLTSKGLGNSEVKKSLDKIFKALNKPSKEYKEIKQKLDSSLVVKLENNPEFKALMKEKLTGDKEKLQKLFNMVEEAKHESFKEVTGIDSQRAELTIDKGGKATLTQGGYANNKVKINESPLGSFLRSRKANNEEILNTFIHELTHHDQEQLMKNKNKSELKGIKKEAEIFKKNNDLYIHSGITDMKKYKRQPLEKEAFETGNKLGKELIKKVNK